MTAWEYMKIEVEKRSFEITLKKYEPVGITFFSSSCFENYFILVINDKMTIKWLKNTLYIKLK